MNGLLSNHDFFHAIQVPCLLLNSNAPTFSILDANKAYLDVTHTSLNDIKQKGIFEVFPDNPLDQLASGSAALFMSLQKVLETRKPQKLLAQKYDIFIEETGEFEVRYWNAINSPVMDDKGNVISIIHSAEDVTENVTQRISQKDVLKVVQYNRKAFQTLLENNVDAIFTTDMNGNFTFSNQQFLDLFDIHFSELYGRNFFSIITDDYRNRAFLLLEKTKRGDAASQILEIKNNNQQVLTLYVTSTPLIAENQQIGMFGIAKNVTDQFRNFHLPTEQLIPFNKNLAGMKCCKMMVDETGICKNADADLISLLGISHDDLKGKTIFSLIPEQDRKKAADLFRHTFQQKGKDIPPFTFIHADGTFRWLGIHVSEYSETNNEKNAIITLYDVTETVLKDIQLQEVTYENEKIFESSVDMICTIGKDGAFKKVSDACFMMLGYFPSELVNKEYMELVHPDDRPKTEEVAIQIMRGLKTSTFQNRYVRKNGEIAHIVWTAQWDEKSELMYCIARDESERINSELILRKERRQLEISNERYEYLKKATNDAIWDWDLKTNHVLWGEGFQSLFGYDPDKMSNDVGEWSSHIHPADLERVSVGLQKVIDSKENFWEDKYRYKKANGDFIMISDRGYIIRRPDGTGRRMIGAMQDINEKEKLEQERRIALEIDEYFYQSNSLESILDSVLKLLLNYTGHYLAEVWVSNFDNSQLLLVSQVSVDHSHSFSEEIRSFAPNIGLPGKCWTERKPVIVENLQQNETFVRKEFAKKNHLRSAKALPIFYKGEVIAVIGFFSQDPFNPQNFHLFGEYLGERLAANIKRKQIEIELNSFFDLSPDLLSVINIDGIYKKINQAFASLLGYKNNELLHANFLDFVHPDDKDIAEQEFQKIMEGFPIFNYECRYKKKSGDYLWLLWNAISNKKQNVIYAVAVDITERKKSEEDLQKSYVEKIDILESIGDGFFTVDENFTVTYWNAKSEEFLNRRKEDTIGKNLWEIFPDAVGKSYYHNYRKVLHDQINVHFEEFYAPLNKWFDLSAYPQKNGVSVFFRDITDKKKITEQFESVIENIPGVTYRCLFDEKWTMIYLSPSVIDLTEYEDTGLLNSKNLSFSDIILEEDLAKTFAIETQLKNKEVFKIEYRIRTKSGKIKWVEDRGRGVYGPNDKLLFIDGVMIDVTDKVNYISAIEEQNKKLQHIAWTQSHIVRAPLSRIIGLCNLISMQHEAQEELTEKIQYLISSANELDQIIRDVVKETENVNPKA